MDSYQDFRLDDFISDPAFRHWVLEGTPDDNAHWAAVLRQYPHQQATIRQAREFLLTVHERVEADFPSEQRVRELYQRIQEAAQATSVRPLWQRAGWQAAAAVLLLLGSGLWWYAQLNRSSTAGQTVAARTEPDRLEEVINNTSSIRTVTLPDGSRATLEPRTRLQYRRAFADTSREVFLAGEAFFDVQKNPSKPFLVRANELTTKVLGTSFRVRAYEGDRQVTVAVKTGRVSVFPTQSRRQRDPETDGVILTPNQQVVFGKADAHFTRSLVEKPVPVLSSAELQRLSFTNAPLPGILQALEKAYGVEIIYDETLLADCRLTTSLGNETLFEKLDILCEAVGASYKLVDAQVIIDSKGCN